MDEIDMDLLRDAFDSTYIDEVGANSIDFSRVIRNKLNAPNLADDILALETDTVSWSTVAVLAKIYKIYKPVAATHVTAISESGDLNDDRKPAKPIKNVSILEAVEVDTNYLTSSNVESILEPVASDSPVLRATKSKLMPAASTDVAQESRLDKDTAPVVSKPVKSVNPITKKNGVFGFTQYQTDESFNDDELDDSNDSIGDKSITKITPQPVSPMRIEIKRAPANTSKEVAPVSDMGADTESKNSILEQIERIFPGKTDDDAKSISSGSNNDAISEAKPESTLPIETKTTNATKANMTDSKSDDIDSACIGNILEIDPLVQDNATGGNDTNNSATSSTTPLKSTSVSVSAINTPRRLPVPTVPTSSLSVLKSLLPHSKLPIIEAELAESTVKFPPKLSALALQSGVILEGWLEKKSATTGLWLRRYYIFSESETDFCTIKIYKSTVKSLWGEVPVKLKGILPISAVASVEVVATKSARGREFTIVTNKSSQSSTSKYSSMFLSGRANFFDTGSDKGSVTSETGNGKSLFLRAPDPVTRLIWETYISGAIKLLTEME